MIRANLDPHEACTPGTDLRTLETTLEAILDDVPDSSLKPKSHNAECWKRHAACLRDKIWKDLGWE